MYISPPITILTILAVVLAGTVWLAPPEQVETHVNIVLPAATYQKLVTWGKEHPGISGRPQAVADIIEGFAESGEIYIEDPVN